MKKLLLLGALALFAGCKKDDPVPPVPPEPPTPPQEPLWDFFPDNICFILQDPDGNNLLDPDNEGNILDANITAKYNDETYVLNEYFDSRTRFILPQWYGLRVGKYYSYDGDEGTPILMFGQFVPVSFTFGDLHLGKEGGYHEETFTIDWGDGTTSEVAFDFYVTWHFEEKWGFDVPTIHKRLWIDGLLISDIGLLGVGVFGEYAATRAWK